MSSFARKRDRKLKKQASAGDKRAIREYKRGRQAVKESMVEQLKRDHKCRVQTLQNLSACFLLAMNRGYKFGVVRLAKLWEKMQSEMDAIVAGYVTVEEIADFLKDEIGLNVGIAESDPNAGHYRQIEFKGVQQMSAAFFMALLDEFNFKKKRLADAYGMVAEISDNVHYGKETYEGIRHEVEVIMSKKIVAKSHYKAVIENLKLEKKAS